MNTEPVVIRIGDEPTEDELICERDIEELLDEVEAEQKKELVPHPSLRKRIQYLFGYYPKKKGMVYKFQRLAGIIDGDTVAALVLPNDQRVFFKQYPKWHQILRWKICGFKYESYF